VVRRRLLLAGRSWRSSRWRPPSRRPTRPGCRCATPDHVAGRRLGLIFGLVGLLVALDVLVRPGRQTHTWWPARAEVRRVRRERWTRRRGIAVAVTLVSFYVSYLAYRNLKSVVPVLRPGDLFDRQLAELDRSLFAGQDPATLMHTRAGHRAATHLMSVAYMIFFLFIPGTLAAALVFSPNLQAGIFYAPHSR
jgi:hypothetical protein